MGTGGSAVDLGGSIAESTQNPGYGQFSHPARVVYPLLSATPDNLPVSLDLLLVNSLAPSLQAPDTLGELPKHSKRVPNRILRTPA
ncbi:hypothetical protein BHM03_00010542 [Ensete ventricosum]|nr:hypothetical protein BHM03_00010542 [Ensete ventricosum]